MQGEVVRYAGRRAAREDDERAGRAESRVAELGESDGGREGVEISLDVREDDAEGATVQGIVLARDGPVVRGGLVVDVVVVVANLVVLPAGSDGAAHRALEASPRDGTRGTRG